MTERIAVVAIVAPIASSIVGGLIYFAFSSQTTPNFSSTDNSTTNFTVETINIGNSEEADEINSYAELNVAGVIVDEKGKPLPNVLVEIPTYNMSSKPSNENGEFSLFREGETDGKDAEVHVKMNYYRTNSDTIDLNDKNIIIRMLKKGY